MFATNTRPNTKTLTASTSPVANVSKSNAATVRRFDNGDAIGMLPRYLCDGPALSPAGAG
jgi:hypothetical protein